jgi:ketosteroid isomerase-like protein
MHRIENLSSAGHWNQVSPRPLRAGASIAIALILCVPLTSLAAQKNNKNAPKQTTVQDATAIPAPPPISDSRAIELEISQMLGAWQVGDEELMHSFYSDDVLVISGAWEPPVQGWKNYLRAYQVQRARTQQTRMERMNTFTKVTGLTAWSTYQWDFIGEVDGTKTEAVGQTTLVFEKRAGKWLIVVNHTSVVPTPQRATPASDAPNSQMLQPTSAPRTAGTPGA